MNPYSFETAARERELWIRTLLLALTPTIAICSIALGAVLHQLIYIGSPGAAACTALICLVRAIPPPERDLRGAPVTGSSIILRESPVPVARVKHAVGVELGVGDPHL